MDKVNLVGITRHGKNRIQQHGSEWIVEEIRGTKMMLRSLNKTEGPMTNKRFDGRWVSLKDDPNFKWEWKDAD